MRKWLLAAIVIWLSTDSSVRADPPRENWTNHWVRTFYRLQGRVLACRIHKGMPDWDVVRILGHGDKPLPSVGLAGCGLFMSRHYVSYGVYVSLSSAGKDVMRVDSVQFQPLFD
jgi:hypothetical protein